MRKLFFFFLALLLANCSGKPYIVETVSSGGNDHRHGVYIVSHGWHTGIVVPAESVQEDLTFLTGRFGNVPYYEIGWGDKGFYQAQEITVGLAVKAIFLPTESVMHIVAVPDSPPDYFSASEIIKLILTDEQLKSLNRFIGNSFYRNQKDEVVPLSKGLYGDSQFYRGEGDYYLFNTCNKWTAKGLRSAGFDLSTTFKLSAGSVMGYLAENCDDTAIDCLETEQ